MAWTRGALALAMALLGPQAVSGVTWIKGSGGASCETVCSARSGCDEDAWPKSQEEFEKIAAEAGHACEGTQDGGAKYDPSTDGHYCGWAGPDDEEPDPEPRCAAKGDSMTYRFCPCNADKEL
mmetsp:Transcript_110510/g.344490  ORF Transcript_110510/g.344490 Transcript_110510/m.344490 type:complete len:123 (+) Transcript_110510:64-432(+)|eukprot:CAMPEP_0204582526 /NCGR_PEP_ID=MMETSP0661-20131031/45269_1 /ASSEMBLY_ACC=CAM_ASM_000606 /TAXON_ID=109239 /ORGANISM="Alexandrium margalefi, Strain AMGDE01CS-322" /LENGTH=122 /DNA_ID=CAMNT_0051591817 /DNA_START=64 /DNA_END=432 /DNA_ORIENTATION=+